MPLLREIGHNQEFTVFLNEEDGSITIAANSGMIAPKEAVWLPPKDVCAITIAVLGWIGAQLEQESDDRAIEGTGVIEAMKALK